MQEILELQKKVVPELVNVLEKRYNLLRTIYHNQPIGRRILSEKLNIGERSVRTETTFLKEQGLIEIHSSGMVITDDGDKVLKKLKNFIHQIKGLTDIENRVKSLLNLKKVIVVPGDVEENQLVLKDLGKACSNYVKDYLKDNCIIALTGGSTLREVVEAFPKINNYSNIQVVPARGGMGKNVETQANTLAASLAKKLNGTYKMLHISESLRLDIIDSLLKEEAVKEIINETYIDRPKMLANFSKMFFYKPISKPFSDWFLNLGLKAAGWSTAAIANTWLDEESLFLDMKKINAPTLIIHGIHDKVCLFPLAEQQKKLIKNSKLVKMQNGGHGSFYDEREKFNNEVKCFIES